MSKQEDAKEEIQPLTKIIKKKKKTLAINDHSTKDKIK